MTKKKRKQLDDSLVAELVAPWLEANERIHGWTVHGLKLNVLLIEKIQRWMPLWKGSI